MPKFDDKHTKICGCTVVWDGITRPGKAPDTGAPAYSLKVVVDPNNPDLPLHQQVAQQCLLESKWRGQFPQGGGWAIGQVKPGEFNDMFPGWIVLNCKSRRLPDVYNEQGQRLDPMQYGALLYGGQKVDVLVHCYEYGPVSGNQGIATGLDAFSIIASANAPRQDFGGGGVDTASAFGGGAPAPGGAPNYGAPGGAPAPNYGAPGGAPAPGAAAPGPAHSFLPPGQ